VTGQVAYRLAAVLAATTTLLVAAWISLELGGTTVTFLVDNGVQAAAALGAGVACFYASRREPFGLGRAWTQALRRGWRLVGAAAIIWGLAKVVWTYEMVLQRQLSYSLADVGFLVSIPLLVTGMLAFPISVGQPAARIRTLLDALIIAASLLAVSWVTTISPLIDEIYQTNPSQLSAVELLVRLASPIFDILVATVALSLLVRTRGRDPAPMTMLCLAMLALAVSCSGYVHLAATGRYEDYNLIDVGRLIGWLLIGVAALRPRAADAMKDTFLSAVSHDLRNPLTAILGVALTLERTKLQLPREKAMELLGMLVEKARKLDRLLADLLDLNRLEQGVLEPNRSHTDISVLVRHLVDEVEHLEGRPIYVDVPGLVADIDAPKVERILENLLINTTRHTPAGTPVWVRGSSRGRDLELVVEDAGPGVPAELAGSIFEPFHQGPNAARKSSGVGIGLSLVARFAELHGGRAWVGERSGGGAAFHVLLPDALVQNGQPAGLPATPAGAPDGRQPVPDGAAEVAQRSGARR
jgi:signal transduction histidine kinase